MFHFFTPWTFQKMFAFWRFQRVQKWNISLKWGKDAKLEHTETRPFIAVYNPQNESKLTRQNPVFLSI